jgi:hypothetical protein
MDTSEGTSIIADPIEPSAISNDEGTRIEETISFNK